MRSAQEKKSQNQTSLMEVLRLLIEGMASDFCVPHLHLFFFLLQYKQ